MVKHWLIRAVTAGALLMALHTSTGAQTPASSDLGTRLREQYDVVALQQGVALVPRDTGSAVRMIQVVDGVVNVDGETLTGQQLRDRLGSDADLVLQVSYLSSQQQRDLAGAAPAPALPDASAPPPSEPVQRTDVVRGDRVRFGGDATVERNERLEGDAVAIGGRHCQRRGDRRCNVHRRHADIGTRCRRAGRRRVRGRNVESCPRLPRRGRCDGSGWWAAGGGFRRGMWFPGFFGTFWSRFGSLAATALRLAVLAMVAVIIVAFGRNAVERIAARTAAAPVRSGLIGLLAEILFVPVMVLTAVVLAVSIIGIPLLFLMPFAVLLVMLVALVGFVGLSYHVGRWIASRFGWSEPGAYASVAMGVVAIGGLTLLAKLAALGGGFIVGGPLTGLGYLVEFVAWTVGFGAAILYW